MTTSDKTDAQHDWKKDRESILAHFDWYGFHDQIGHRLTMCSDFLSIVDDLLALRLGVVPAAQEDKYNASMAKQCLGCGAVYTSQSDNSHFLAAATCCDAGYIDFAWRPHDESDQD